MFSLFSVCETRVNLRQDTLKTVLKILTLTKTIKNMRKERNEKKTSKKAKERERREIVTKNDKAKNTNGNKSRVIGMR